MSLTAKPEQGPSTGGRVRRTGRWISERWERAQMRLGSMVLSDVPLVLIGTVLVLTAFGIVMVLSASSVEQISAGLRPYDQARSQAMFAVMGFVLMLIIGFSVPVRFYRQPWVLNLALLVVAGLLVAVILFGSTVGGNRNWINLGGFSLQPSEMAKPITILWLAMVFSRQGKIHEGTAAQTIYKALMPAFLGFAVIVALILAGHDLGTVLVYCLFFVVILLSARPSRITVLAALGGIGVAALGFVITSPNRVERIFNTFAFWRDCVEATCDQANSGLAALATGGFWGVGLGQSRQKYNYLPEAHNDYIFAVIGEELGLLGAISVLVLYAALLYCAMRILLRSSDLFIRFATLGMITWLVGQAMMNIAMVVGVMPVIGVPLPFVSYGGSALVSSLVGAGFLIGFARQTPLQPIVGQQAATGGNRIAQKDAARRVKLGRVVAAEQDRIAADPYSAGWTLEKFKQRFWPAPPPAQKHRAPAATGANRQTLPGTTQPSPSSGQTRPSAQTVRRSAGVAPGQAQEKAPRRPSGSATGVRASSKVQHAQQGTTTAPTEATATGSKSVGSQAQEQQPAAKLPAGLRTIRKAREVPPRRNDES